MVTSPELVPTNNLSTWNKTSVALLKYVVQIYSCDGGDDIRKPLEVWDAVTGAKQFELKGHDAPVSFFILSTTVNEKIKGWLYDTSGSKHDINARGVSRIAFSDDGTRVFSCGTNKGEPFMVEWHEGEGGVRHNYKGLYHF
ncbi:topless-related protein 4-like protein isoform X2 [Tanacetum coccineum]